MTDDKQEAREAAEAYLRSLHDEWRVSIGDDYWLGERIALGQEDDHPLVQAFAQARLAGERAGDADRLDAIAEMMGEFVDNWPEPKHFDTALKLIAKTMRAALDPPNHKFWMPGEPDCPREIKAGNGELHTLRCKVCGQDSPRVRETSHEND